MNRSSCSPLLANLTCNPGIIYDLFINNPKANIGHKFNTRDEVMTELGRILGPGCDISVELNDPFGKSDAEILEEAEHFRELLTEYRVVIKVPHTGPVNRDNVGQLLASDEFSDMAGRVVLTAEPNYLARFASSNQVVSYQRRFMNAANGAK